MSRLDEPAVVLLDTDEQNAMESMASNLRAVGYDCRSGKLWPTSLRFSPQETESTLSVLA